MNQQQTKKNINFLENNQVIKKNLTKEDISKTKPYNKLPNNIRQYKISPQFSKNEIECNSHVIAKLQLRNKLADNFSKKIRFVKIFKTNVIKA